MTVTQRPPLQRCAGCGAEWFFVHDCPEASAPPTSLAPRRDVIHVRDLLTHIEDLERLVKEQQRTITNLMLELAEHRIIRERQSAQSA